MVVSLDPHHLRVYRGIARLLLKYGREDIVAGAGLEAALLDEDRTVEVPADRAAALADDLEAMGPTFVKLGQLLSTRGDLLPPAYVAALGRLQDELEPFPFVEVEATVRDELGVRLSKAFTTFDEEPVAAASLGQVHHARLRDGRPVAVKVQRPGVRARVVDDLEALTEIAEVLDRRTEVGRSLRLVELVGELRRSLLRELDYRREAEHLVTLGRNLARYDRIVVPQPVDDYTTSRVLTMDLVRGRKLTDLGPLAQLELDGELLASQLVSAYLDQVMADGFVHADPHPGNVLLTDDGRIALLDLGMVAHVPPAVRERILKLLLAMNDGQVEDVVDAAVGLGEPGPDLDPRRLRAELADLVHRYQDRAISDIRVGAVVLEVSRATTTAGLRPPPALTLLAKALLNLDEIARLLDPGFEPDDAVRRRAAELASRQVWRSLSPSNAFSAVLDVKEFVEKLPARINRIADAIASGELTVNVESFDEERIIDGLHRMANRVATGVILAALILGAALLMQVETESTVLGYPTIAMVFFLVAAVLSLGLVVSILWGSRSRRRR